MKKFIFSLFLFFSTHAGANEKATVELARTAISEGTPVIDVRQEACNGYVKGANLISIDEFVNAPDSAIARVSALVGNDKSKKIIVYCRSGNRSRKVIAILEKRGFTNLENIGGVGDYFDPQTMQKCKS
ncbi:MAG: hypothetical protein A4S09_04490 [Proteobacteria bacterium SG_bin7]|nr:MAG: hypothetical protein A4S09_04490 [Proteobacteria bacterium SG_bin7]